MITPRPEECMTPAEKKAFYMREDANHARKRRLLVAEVKAERTARELEKKRAELLAASAEVVIRILIAWKSDEVNLLVLRARDELIEKLS